MAGYSEQREQNIEMKYLHKVLAEVDDGIPVPDSVRGSALRGRLDDVYPAKAAPPNKKSGLKLHTGWLSWQSGFSYAAAFALIVSLFYGLGFNRQPDSIVQDRVDILSPGSEEPLDWPRVFPELGEEADSRPAVPNPTGISGSEEAAQPETVALPDGETAVQPAKPGISTFDGGVGGGSVTLFSDVHEGYEYTWRVNDPTDPDKEQFPITVDIMEEGSQHLVAQIDIPDTHSVVERFFVGSRLCFIGQTDTGIVTRLYDVADPSLPAELAAITGGGAYVASRRYDGILYVASYAADAGTLDCEMTPLPNSVLSGACVIEALDLEGGGWSQAAFAGAGEETKLYDLNAYNEYKRQSPEDTEPAMDYARISLDGLDISLP